MSVKSAGPEARSAPPERITSIDALRGVVMLVMIFVNDLGDVPGDIVPAWMKHYRGENGMTFVDLVFPAFLFIVGMSIPFALNSRLKKGESAFRIFFHVLLRALSLLFLGILMVNGRPDTDKMGWSGWLWCVLMYVAAIFAFSVISPGGKPDAAGKSAKTIRVVSIVLRCLGLATLVFLAFAFRNKNGNPMIRLSPFNIHHIWYGILGYIGWAYLVSGIVFLLFRTNLTAILGCCVLMMCLYPANKQAMFEGLWIAKHVNIGVALGSRAAITGLGLLLGAMLLSPATKSVGSRVRFTLLLTAGCVAAAWLLGGLYGISKDNATPSWSLWGCAATAALWLIFYFISDVQPIKFIARPFAIAGQNVLLPYLISEMLPYVVGLAGIDGWYQGLAGPTLSHAIARSAICSVVILSASVGLNRLGLRLKL
jgi:heparan-alpha-glucosaminide N-acetyltransferase